MPPLPVVRPRVRVRAGSSSVPATLPAEGEPRPGPWHLHISGGWLPANVGDTWNWWQRGYDVLPPFTRSAIVEACVSAYAQTIAMCPGSHWIANGKGGRERVTTSALSRVLRRPNSYQSMSDFLLNAVRDLYLTGNAFALALRNDRYEVSQLHLMQSRQCSGRVSVEGEVFYNLAGNEIIEKLLQGESLIVPQRDVLHIRLHTPRHPLKGESPLMAVALDLAAGDAMLAQQIAFYSNMARPSMILTTDLVLDKDQTQALRERWNEQSRGLNAGGTPILTAGLKPHTLSATADDSQLADILKMTEQHIALAFRVPLQILGLGGSPFGSTELLMQNWIATGLGFALNHVEEAFGKLFQLKGLPDEYLELDTGVLLRSAFKERVEAFARGVQTGIFAPNDARNEFEYNSVEYGDEPRVQQQVVPLSAAGAIPKNPGPPGAPGAPPTPFGQPQPGQQPGQQPPPFGQQQQQPQQLPPSFKDQRDAERTRTRAVRELFAIAERFDRQRAAS
jgi:HK97 family phage portal protein